METNRSGAVDEASRDHGGEDWADQYSHTKDDDSW